MLQEKTVFCQLQEKEVSLVCDWDWAEEAWNEGIQIDASNAFHVIQCMEASGGKCDYQECVLLNRDEGMYPFDTKPVFEAFDIEKE